MTHVFKTLRLCATVVTALVAGPLASAATAATIEKTDTIAGLTLRYKVVLPANFDPAKAYPAVLAFPPGDQSMYLVNATLDQSYRAEAERRGYIVIEPAAPDGMVFPRGGDRVFPAFLAKLTADYKIQDNKFHAAGNSNGGRSAFLVASRHPQYFRSVTGFPGLLDNATPGQLKALGALCIHMYVGEHDPGWAAPMKDQLAALRAAGTNVTFETEKGESHVLGTLMGSGARRLFDQFDAARMGQCAK